MMIDLVEARLSKRLLVRLVGAGGVEPLAIPDVTGQSDGFQSGCNFQIAIALSQAAPNVV